MEFSVTAFLTDQGLSPARLAVEAEARGFAALYLPEHTHLPVRNAAPPGLVEGVAAEDYRRSLDPMVALAMAASVTSVIRLGTGVLLVAQHDPIVLAKQVATLDHLSGGRLDLGIGFGWNRAEAEDHGVDFDRRRDIAREHVGALRALWTQDPAEYHGEHVDVPACWAWPKPVQDRVPVLVGGGAHDSVFAAIAAYGDGWMPIGGAGLGEGLPRLRTAVESAGRDPDAVRVVPFGTVPTEGKLSHFASLGINEVVLRLPSGPADATLGALDDHRALIDRWNGKA